MCEWGNDELVMVPEPFEHWAWLWKLRKIDSCIAPIVRALNSAGLHTAASCCGHGKGPVSILLHDGREVTIGDRGDLGRSAREQSLLARCARQRRELRRLNAKIRDVSHFMAGRWHDFGQRRYGQYWWAVCKAVGATTMDTSGAEVVQRVERLARADPGGNGD